MDDDRPCLPWDNKNWGGSHTFNKKKNNIETKKPWPKSKRRNPSQEYIALNRPLLLTHT